MSQVLINQIDQDLTEVDFFQHGQNHTETMLREELLNGEKSYHFCISNLNVPLKHAPIHPVTADTLLFRVRRRFQGGPDPGTWCVRTLTRGILSRATSA